MSKNRIQLKNSSILQVPLQCYEKDFMFIVNGKEYETSRIIADLLSPIICHNHAIDITINEFIINTHTKGDFSLILNLINFAQIEITENNLPFILEVFEFLGNDSIDFFEANQSTELTADNIFTQIQYHEKFSKFYSKRLLEEIDFISSNFNSLCETKFEELTKLDSKTLCAIFNNEKLQIKDEDQLLNFCNVLYSKSKTNSFFYEFVIFSNVSTSAMNEFIDHFELNDITQGTWIKLCERLKEELKESKQRKSHKYTEKVKKGIEFKYSESNQFSGIINYLNKKNQNINNCINITSSSVYGNRSNCSPTNVVLFNDQNNFFFPNDEQNCWICFDFKERRVVPTHYTIKTSTASWVSGLYPKSWIIQGSLDNKTWETIDEVKKTNSLNGSGSINTFTINKQNEHEFRYIKMKSTGYNTSNSSYFFSIDSFEIYGNLI